MELFRSSVEDFILNNKQLKNNIKRIDDHYTGIRHYSFNVNNKQVEVPSVTAIIGETSDKENLNLWKDRIGENKAESIKENSAKRGSVMHRLIEIYYEMYNAPTKQAKINWLLNKSDNDEEINSYPTKSIIQGTRLFFKLLDDSDFIDSVKPILLEQKLWFYKKFKDNIIGYAGTVDFIGLKNNKLIIIDFKTARKSKIHVDKYKLQIAAYVFAFYYITGYFIEYGEVWIANEMETEEGRPQKIKITKSEIENYFKEFIYKCKQFNQFIYLNK